ncbi:hypothetical protein E2C01_016030 [Portunus trituberculatus]|uniref:Uncharacterized protein n=1 Tax=Portunus trituberculatus TaxID=210409 RepID=A0A5B7DPG5_PORTR|nr:hypothetical protein [Portunus trituberculatus]
MWGNRVSHLCLSVCPALCKSHPTVKRDSHSCLCLSCRALLHRYQSPSYLPVSLTSTHAESRIARRQKARCDRFTVY